MKISSSVWKGSHTLSLFLSLSLSLSLKCKHLFLFLKSIISFYSFNFLSIFLSLFLSLKCKHLSLFLHSIFSFLSFNSLSIFLSDFLFSSLCVSLSRRERKSISLYLFIICLSMNHFVSCLNTFSISVCHYL